MEAQKFRPLAQRQAWHPGRLAPELLTPLHAAFAIPVGLVSFPKVKFYFDLCVGEGMVLKSFSKASKDLIPP